MLGSTSQINQFMNLFGAQSGLSMEQIAKTAGNGESVKTKDAVTISPSINMLQQLLNLEMQAPDGTSLSGEQDLSGLAQLKQRGDMLANMLKVKLKNFESNLISEMKSAGMNPAQAMNVKDGENGLMLLNEIPNKDSVQNMLVSKPALKDQFQEIARFAKILEAFQQTELQNVPEKSAYSAVSPVTQYSQQSQTVRPEKRPDAEFVIHIMQGGTSYNFE